MASLVGQLKPAVVTEREVRVVGHFPKMTVGITEIAAIAAPEHILRRLADGRAGAMRFLDDNIHTRFRAAVPGEREASECLSHILECDVRIPGKLVGRPHGNGAGSRLKKSDTFGGLDFPPKTQSLVKNNASLEVRNTQCHQAQECVRLTHASNKPSCCAPEFGLRKCSVVSCVRDRLIPSFSQAISNRRP